MIKLKVIKFYKKVVKVLRKITKNVLKNLAADAFSGRAFDCRLRGPRFRPGCPAS